MYSLIDIRLDLPNAKAAKLAPPDLVKLPDILLLAALKGPSSSSSSSLIGVDTEVEAAP